MSVFTISLASVTLAEIGDKTQLLSLVLVSRFGKPLPIIAAIVCATLLNHAVAAWLGMELSSFISPQVLRYLLIMSFIAMAIWILIPDKLEQQRVASHGPFIASFIAFFIAEVGDKTQIATTILGARYPEELSWVVIGSTLGMLLANAPVVWIGRWSADKLPLPLVRRVTAVLFVVLALFTGFGV
ncbi:TMEM165/GDT1 family protein [Dongshaea marina]|uniref:TMEM165/GDT1 family protein n=1 Tax=Dongshaea marina TaxID=2047966 RepID=UPI000D3E10C3|nr:TMEM165/GDT1 family protein [Dongshaea marina]